MKYFDDDFNQCSEISRKFSRSALLALPLSVVISFGLPTVLLAKSSGPIPSKSLAELDYSDASPEYGKLIQTAQEVDALCRQPGSLTGPLSQLACRWPTTVRNLLNELKGRPARASELSPLIRTDNLLEFLKNDLRGTFQNGDRFSRIIRQARYVATVESLSWMTDALELQIKKANWQLQVPAAKPAWASVAHEFRAWLQSVQPMGLLRALKTEASARELNAMTSQLMKDPDLSQLIEWHKGNDKASQSAYRRLLSITAGQSDLSLSALPRMRVTRETIALHSEALLEAIASAPDESKLSAFLGSVPQTTLDDLSLVNDDCHNLDIALAATLSSVSKLEEAQLPVMRKYVLRACQRARDVRQPLDLNRILMEQVMPGTLSMEHSSAAPVTPRLSWIANLVLYQRVLMLAQIEKTLRSRPAKQVATELARISILHDVQALLDANPSQSNRAQTHQAAESTPELASLIEDLIMILKTKGDAIQ